MGVEILSNTEFDLELELYQEYERFNIYNVYKVYKKTKEKKFLYRITKDRDDFGRKIASRQELLHELDARLGEYENERKNTGLIKLW